MAKEVTTKSSKEKSISKLKSLNATDKQELQKKLDEESKFRNYFEFGMNVKYIKPHQVKSVYFCHLFVLFCILKTFNNINFISSVRC